MTKISAIRPEFVDEIPETLRDGVLYISELYSVAAHICCCGCGERINTSLKPTRWSLVYDNDTVSLYPSIGNWRLPCQSHYWIRSNQIEWAAKMSQVAIEKGRLLDRIAKESHRKYNSNPPLTFRLKAFFRILLFHVNRIGQGTRSKS